MLNNISQIKKIDKNGAYKAIEFLPDQISQVIRDSLVLKIPKEYSKIQNVVVNGMGGSNLGARVAQSLFSDQLNIPLLIAEGYEVPEYVNKNTLYVLSSYSGNTEEILSVYMQAKKRKAKIIAITAQGNGKLEKLMLEKNIPGYIFSTKFNAGQEPRFAIGYAMGAISIILAKTGIIELNVKTIKAALQKMEIWNRSLRINKKTENNLAKKTAKKLFNKIPILIGGQFLEGNIFSMRNQFCESSKNFANYLILPDMNHFALEGLANPKSNPKNLIFIFFNSNLYSNPIKKRIKLTQQIVRKNKINIIDIKLKGKTKFEQSIEVLQLGTYITYYLGILNKVNPSTNPYVDWFKKNL